MRTYERSRKKLRTANSKLKAASTGRTIKSVKRKRKMTRYHTKLLVEDDE